MSVARALGCCCLLLVLGCSSSERGPDDEEAVRRYVAAWAEGGPALAGTIAGPDAARLTETIRGLRTGGVERTTLAGLSRTSSDALEGTVVLGFPDGARLQLTIRATVDDGRVRAEPAAVSTRLTRWQRLRIVPLGPGKGGAVLSRNRALLAARPELAPTVELIERALAHRLTGSRGRRLVTAETAQILAESGPVDGEDVVTSLDEAMQAAAEESLGEAPGALVALDPGTGGIRALVSNPEPRAPDVSPAVASYSPGSAFKIVTAAAALEHSVLESGDVVQCPARTTTEEAQIINFQGIGYGPITFETAFAVSCNTAFAEVGLAVGTVRLLETARRLGLRVRSPGVPQGISVPRSRGELAVWSYGAAGSLVSPVRMAGIGATIARGGVLVSPGWVDRTGAGRRVLRARTAAALVGMMEKVVESGTGTQAALPGVRVAGKTGTADPRRPGGRSDAWFVCLAPSRPTRLVVVGFLPGGGIGGQSAASLVRRFLLETKDTWS